jgi:hypothetical protein
MCIINVYSSPNQSKYLYMYYLICCCKQNTFYQLFNDSIVRQMNRENKYWIFVYLHKNTQVMYSNFFTSKPFNSEPSAYKHAGVVQSRFPFLAVHLHCVHTTLYCPGSFVWLTLLI